MEQAMKILTDAMGGRKVFPAPLSSEKDLVKHIRAGLPSAAIDALMEQFKLTAEDLVGPLGVSVATIKRRHQHKHLNPAVSDRLFRVAAVVSIATEVLGSREKAARWLHKPNRALSGDTPLSRLDTSIGFSQVEDVLHRIEHGLFA